MTRSIWRLEKPGVGPGHQSPCFFDWDPVCGRTSRPAVMCTAWKGRRHDLHPTAALHQILLAIRASSRHGPTQKNSVRAQYARSWGKSGSVMLISDLAGYDLTRKLAEILLLNGAQARCPDSGPEQAQHWRDSWQIQRLILRRSAGSGGLLGAESSRRRHWRSLVVSVICDYHVHSFSMLWRRLCSA